MSTDATSCSRAMATTASISAAMMSEPLCGVTARLTRNGRAAGRLAPCLKEEWVLTIPPRWRGQVDPMTGWWGGGDPLATITLRFSSREAAETYARRAGIVLDVSETPVTVGPAKGVSMPLPDGLDSILPWAWDGRVPLLDPDAGEFSADQADAELALTDPAGVFASPMDVTRHPRLTRQEKLEILKRWEWDARLIEAAQDEGMPDAGEPSRLGEVLDARRALLSGHRRGDGARRASEGARRVPSHASRRTRTDPDRRVVA